jgi:ectoine hydroxylase-related dioxygenase (phytanoyl-CoA dioxygenase family)
MGVAERETKAGSYRIHYTIHHHFWPEREVEVLATPEEIADFTETGYLVRERLFSGEQVARLRAALDEVAEQENHLIRQGKDWGGVFLRHLMDKHPVFLELFRFEPTLSVARAVLGPQVQVLPMTGRLSYPDGSGQATPWHHHQRVLPEPMPPFFCRPHVLDALLYLDDADDANGPLCVVPGSHQRVHEAFPGGPHDDLPGQVVLRVPAGSCILIHGNLWHRALETTAEGTLRRLLILPYAASWLKLPSYGERPENGLMQALYRDADQETRELLGVPEGLY